MTLLALGLALFVGAHLFKRIAPGLRASLGTAGRGLVALAILAGVVLMVIGYRGADYVHLYALPGWAWHLNNLLMLIAVFLFGAGSAKGVVASRLRHPMLTGAGLWALAHLLVNGDLASVLLFGVIWVWSMAEKAAINRAEGPWTPPEPGPISKDLRVGVIALILYAAIAGIHYWLGYPVFGGGT